VIRFEALMISEQDFRRVALGLKGVVEASHMGHPDFRANGRIFATLHGDATHGMVKLTPEQQREMIDAHPRVFSPEAGAWGQGGSTRVRFDACDLETAGEALTLAWRNIMSKPPARAKARKTR
jgi:hypothetical protein